MKIVKHHRLLLLALSAGMASAQRVGAPTGDLTKLGVDELFNLQVTSVGRKAQRMSKAPAAVFVLTSEDIRRSGATCIPEALQRVPGLTVLHVDGRSWVVSARGSAQLYSENMLVMIDGRSLYTPLFSGVLWDAIDVPMDDIEQIEVVRGPVAVMWGPNAVNGVINIITKKASSTKGAQASVAVGNDLREQTNLRWGAAPSDRISYRVWGKFDYRTPAYGSPGYYMVANTYVYRGAPVTDLDAGSGSAGFRIDGQPTEQDKWMLAGNLSILDRQDPIASTLMTPGPTEVTQGHSDYRSGYIQGSWTKSASAGEGVLRFSYDRLRADYPFLGGTLNNFTADYQKRWETGDTNEIYAGGGYQQYWDSTTGTPSYLLDPANSVYRAGNLVIRDELQLAPGILSVSAGVRVDYSSYHRIEYQPSLRLLYTPSGRQSVWLAASRAVRTPDRLDRDIRVDDGFVVSQGLPIQVTVNGSKYMRSEVERSLETGYRLQSGQHWSVDTSLFWSYYERLRAFETPLMPLVTFNGWTPSFSMPGVATNSGSGRSYGGEISGVWQVRSGWKLMPSYSYINEAKWLPRSATALYNWAMNPYTVPHQSLLRSQHDLTQTLQFDLMARALSRNPQYNLPGGLLIDARIGWRPMRNSELSFAAQNITDRRMLEAFSQGPNVAIPVRRTFFLKWTQRL